MPKRRDQIGLSPNELEDLLAEERKLVLSTLGTSGWPHVTAMWYVLRNGEPWIFTYGKSQKVRNLERDPRATLLVERGDSYDRLRGAMLVARAEVHRDFGTVAAVADDLFRRYEGRFNEDPELDERTRGAVEARVPKRVVVRFEVLRTVSWDHSKLAGAY